MEIKLNKKKTFTTFIDSRKNISDERKIISILKQN